MFFGLHLHSDMPILLPILATILVPICFGLHSIPICRYADIAANIAANIGANIGANTSKQKSACVKMHKDREGGQGNESDNGQSS